MSVNQGVVGIQRNPDSPDPVAAKFGNQGETLTGAMNGFFYEQTMRGNAYVYTTALAGNALVAPTTTNAPAIWNPPMSGRSLTLWAVKFGRTAKGTPLEGSIVYSAQPNVKSGPGTGADIVSATFVAGKNLRLDLADNSGMLFAPTTLVTTFTPSLLCASGLAQTADNGATTVSGPHLEQAADWLYGSIVLYPGTFLSLAAAVSISTTYTISIFAVSLPLPLTGTP